MIIIERERERVILKSLDNKICLDTLLPNKKFQYINFYNTYDVKGISGTVASNINLENNTSNKNYNFYMFHRSINGKYLETNGNTSCAKNSIYDGWITFEYRVYAFCAMCISIIYKE